MSTHDSDEKDLIDSKKVHKFLKYFLLIILCLFPVVEEWYSNSNSTPEIPLPELSTDQEYFLLQDDWDIEIDLGEIYINELVPATDDVGRNYPNSEVCRNVVWEEKDVAFYYGKKLVPPYIPAGLQASHDNTTQEAVITKEGEVWEDTVWLNFYHDYYEDGSPKMTDDISTVKGFYLKASKIGLLADFCFTDSSGDAKASNIGGTEVYIGYKSMEYGPYDPNTHDPCGYYDMYVVLFSFDGIEYELVFSQIELEDVVKVAASILYDEKTIILKNGSSTI